MAPDAPSDPPISPQRQPSENRPPPRVFCGGPGATGRSYSDEPTILRSIRDTLLRLPDETIVHTGHGDSTTIGAERERVLARAVELGV